MRSRIVKLEVDCQTEEFQSPQSPMSPQSKSEINSPEPRIHNQVHTVRFNLTPHKSLIGDHSGKLEHHHFNSTRIIRRPNSKLLVRQNTEEKGNLKQAKIPNLDLEMLGSVLGIHPTRQDIQQSETQESTNVKPLKQGKKSQLTSAASQSQLAQGHRAIPLNMLDPVNIKSGYLSTLKEHYRLQSFVGRRNHRNNMTKGFSGTEMLQATGTKYQSAPTLSNIITSRQQKQLEIKEKNRTDLNPQPKKVLDQPVLGIQFKLDYTRSFKETVEDALKRNNLALKIDQLGTPERSSESRSPTGSPAKSPTKSPKKELQSKQSFKFEKKRSPSPDSDQEFQNMLYEKFIKPYNRHDDFDARRKQANQLRRQILYQDLITIRKAQRERFKEVFTQKKGNDKDLFKSETLREALTGANTQIASSVANQRQDGQPTHRSLENSQDENNFISTKRKRTRRSQDVKHDQQPEKASKISLQPLTPLSIRPTWKRFPHTIEQGVNKETFDRDKVRLLDDIMKIRKRIRINQVEKDAEDFEKVVGSAGQRELMQERRNMIMKVKNQFVMRGNFAMLSKRSKGAQLQTLPTKREQFKSIESKVRANTEMSEVTNRWNSLRQKITDSLDVKSLLGIKKQLTLENLLKADHVTKTNEKKPNQMELEITTATEVSVDNLPRFKDVQVSSKEVQQLGYHSANKQVSAFLLQQGIVLQLAVTSTSDILAKLIYYGKFLKARQQLKKTPKQDGSEAYNRGVVYAYSNLLKEADSCFAEALIEWKGPLQTEARSQRVFRAIATPIVVKLRLLDYKGVIDLFNQYGERGAEDSVCDSDGEETYLKERLFVIYRFAKEMYKRELKRLRPKQKKVEIKITDASEGVSPMIKSQILGPFQEQSEHSRKSFLDRTRQQHIASKITVLDQQVASSQRNSLKLVQNTQKIQQPKTVKTIQSEKDNSRFLEGLHVPSDNNKTLESSEASSRPNQPAICVDQLSEPSEGSKSSRHKPMIQIDNVSVSQASSHRKSHNSAHGDSQSSLSADRSLTSSIASLEVVRETGSSREEISFQSKSRLEHQGTVQSNKLAKNSDESDPLKAMLSDESPMYQKNVAKRPSSAQVIKSNEGSELNSDIKGSGVPTISRRHSPFFDQQDSAVVSNIKKSPGLTLNLDFITKQGQDSDSHSSKLQNTAERRAKFAKREDAKWMSLDVTALRQSSFNHVSPHKMNNEENGSSRHEGSVNSRSHHTLSISNEAFLLHHTKTFVSPIFKRSPGLSSQLSSSSITKFGSLKSPAIKQKTIQREVRKNLIQVERFINVMGGPQEMYKFIKQFQAEYNQGKGFYQVKKDKQKRKSLLMNTSQNTAQGKSAQVLAHTRYSDHLQVIFLLASDFKKSKKDFKRKFLAGQNSGPRSINLMQELLNPMEDSKEDDITSQSVSLQLSSPSRKSKQIRETETNDGKTAREVQLFTKSPTKHNGRDGSYELSDLGKQSFNTFNNQENAEITKELSASLTLDQVPVDQQAFTIKNYFKQSDLQLTKETEKRLQNILDSAKDGAEIKIWQHQPLKLHEVLNIDYQSVANVRNTMRKLERANKNDSFDSEKQVAFVNGEDSLNDYLNDSHAAFVVKYQNTLVQYEDLIKRSFDLSCESDSQTPFQDIEIRVSPESEQ